jgi:hypothetical protein
MSAERRAGRTRAPWAFLAGLTWLAVTSLAGCVLETGSQEDPSSGEVRSTALEAGRANAVVDEFTPSEGLVTPFKIVDAEYNQSRAEFTWADDAGRLWVGEIDRLTGRFAKYSGRSTLVDPQALSLGDIKSVVKTGAEWIETADGPQLVYTKFVDGLPHDPENARIARAIPQPDGTWNVETLDDDNTRMAPYGSEDPGDPDPRITYVDDAGKHYLRNLLDADSEIELPFVRPVPVAVRHARGDRSLVFTSEVDGVFQVFRYRVDSQELQQLTFDDAQKDRATVPWMWRAPELADDLVLLTIADYGELRIYRSASGDENDPAPWEMIRSARLPPGGVIGSPEPFTHNGKSFVFFQATTAASGHYPTQLWLVNIDPANPRERLLTEDDPFRVRIDPELFVSRRGPFIYFNRYDPSQGAGVSPYCDACYEGVYRAFTGLRAAR